MAQNNYINRLENDLAAAEAFIGSLTDELSSIRAYLSSDKFASDHTVQTMDVDTRIREALSTATTVWMERKA